MKLDVIYNEDCLEGMRGLPDKSIDMILCDLPYGITACKWDRIISLEPLWEQYKRIIKDNGAIVLSASQPFTSKLVTSNLQWFKYEWIWSKRVGSGFLNANRMPLKSHESILVFYNKQPIYNKQKWVGKPNHAMGNFKITKNSLYGNYNKIDNYDKSNNLKNPLSVIAFDKIHPSITTHPTQKPVALFEYLIKTYSDEDDVILDNCMGSGTTAVACKQLGRHYIGFEINPEDCEIAEERIKNVHPQLPFPPE